MGLGKTIQMLGLIINSIKSNTLLIGPIAILNQWMSLAEKCSIKCFTLVDGKWILQTKMFRNSSSLYLCGYEMARKNLRLIRSMEFDRLICDEAHRLSNPKTSTYKALANIKACSTWLLTATPIVNSKKDLDSLFQLLNIEEDDVDIRKYVLARSMEQLRNTISNAPLAPIIISHELEFLSKEEAELYRGIQEPILNQLRYGQINGLFRLALMLRLRQLSIHPNVYIKMKQKQKIRVEGYGGSSTKFIKIEELISNESSQNHKWIIFCHFRMEMDMLETMFKAESCVEMVQQYHGGLTAEAKQDVIGDIVCGPDARQPLRQLARHEVRGQGHRHMPSPTHGRRAGGRGELAKTARPREGAPPASICFEVGPETERWEEAEEKPFW
jgi:SNF2 family DNA or RNA helicase